MYSTWVAGSRLVAISSIGTPLCPGICLLATRGSHTSKVINFLLFLNPFFIYIYIYIYVQSTHISLALCLIRTSQYLYIYYNYRYYSLHMRCQMGWPNELSARFPFWEIMGFEPWSSQTNDFKIDICHYLARCSVDKHSPVSEHG